jgi:HEAT repeat protein
VTRRALPLAVRLAAVLAAAAPLCACPRRVPTVRETPLVDAGEGNRPWSAGTPAQRARIAAAIERLRTATPEEALEVDRRLAAEGEPAVPALLEALRGPDATSRGHAAYVLGAMKDRRTVPALAEAVADPVPVVRYEAAAALLELKDARGLPVLVDGLEDRDARLRAKCVEVLAEHTGLRLGFEPAGSLEERAAAVRRWRAWLARRGT